MVGYLGTMWNGLNIYVDKYLVRKAIKKWCRSKKKRIRKKWAKNPKNYWIVPDTENIIMIGDTAFCHPILWDKIKNSSLIKKNNA